MRKSKKDRLPPFTPTENSLIDSDVYKKLTNASRVAYLLLCRQKRRFDQADVIFPYSHAAAYMDQHTWGRSIRELIACGLIGKKQEGGLYRKTNIYTIHGISKRTVEMHSVKNGEIVRTGAQMHSVDFKQAALTH
jgi:hypothetical protein